MQKKNGKDLLVIYGKDAHFPEQLSTEKDYEIAKALIGEQTLEQLHIVTEHKELEKLTRKQIKTKSIQGLVKESIDGHMCVVIAKRNIIINALRVRQENVEGIPGCGSAWLERLVWDQEVAGSNPVTPICAGVVQW